MYKLIEFIRRIYVVLLFIVIEAIALNYYAHSSHFTQARILTQSNRLAGGIHSAFRGVKRFFALLERVAALENELSFYREQTLFAALDTVGSPLAGPYRYTTARVVANSINKQENLLTLNKGRDFEVSPETAVVTPSGAMVGYIVSCSDRYSVAVSILNTSFRASGEVAGDGHFGSIYWDGFDAELDNLRLMSRDSKTWLANLEREEQIATGIKNLRIKYNGAFGYFIEITKSNLNLVPPHYIRRQTMTNAERYTTEDLRKKEREILHSEVAAMEREDAIFTEVTENVLKYFSSLMKTSHALAEIDVFRGWAELARDWDYCRPEIDESGEIFIEDGRHPVVEQVLKKNGTSKTLAFVPNDTFLSSGEEQIAIITGPNMAGKSTYIRQVALISLLAQTGCFVPAKSCKIGILDRIFSRVGASDELSKGNSTFMVEMNETANILNNATSRSLIILDEIGRGTSTYDGLSIAWGVVEYLHGKGNSGPKTLFATHYHELTRLEGALPRLVNYRIAVKEWNDEIIFIRKIEKGAADKSYGIQVARLAGLPREVIERAKEILSELEAEGFTMREHLALENKIKRKPSARKPQPDWESRQMSLF